MSGYLIRSQRGEDPIQSMLRQELRTRLNTDWHNLPAREASVIALRYIGGGFTQKETAAHLGISPHIARRLEYAALAHLQADPVLRELYCDMYGSA